MNRLGFLVFVFVPLFGYAQSDVDTFINEWHRAATDAKAEKFFGMMASDAVYIGTDATERWSKDEFYSFAKPYFDKGKAWDFKAYDRQIHKSKDGEYVWFSELLNTWMGVCRGSGVLQKDGNTWKIRQYHLSVTVPNEAITDFISLVENFNKQKK